MIIHKANSRGIANHGWLNSRHTFSFANYYSPDRMNFGVLRVLNDDSIAGGTGFATHPHDNMEIISIPLEGKLVHKDSMGNEQVIEEGEIQAMSAGTGIYHSEKNGDSSKPAKFLQIWVLPNKRDVAPRYDQIKWDPTTKNVFQQIVSPNPTEDGVWIHQNAWFYLGDFDQTSSIVHPINAPTSNGIYAFLIYGKAVINGQELQERDGFGVWNTASIEITTYPGSRLLLMEVPMTF